MRRRHLPFAILLVVLLAGGASARDGDEEVPPFLPTRTPTLGLLDHGEWVWGALLDPEEGPGEEEEDDTSTTRDWLEEALGDAGASPTDLLQRVEIDVLVRGRHGAERARLVTEPGRHATLARTRALRFVAGYDVELACDNSGGLRPSAVGNPWLATALEGLALDVVPHVLSEGGRLALDAVVQVGAFDRPVERLATGARFLGEVDLPRYRGALLFASGAAPLVLETVDEQGESLSVQLLARWRRPRSREVRRYDASLLVASRLRSDFGVPPGWLDEQPARVRPLPRWEAPAVDRGVLWAEILDRFPDAPFLVVGSGDVWLAGGDAAQARLGAFLDAQRTRAGRTVRVSLVLRAGDTILERTTLPVLTGRTAFFRLGEDRALVVDADTEVG